MFNELGMLVGKVIESARINEEKDLIEFKLIGGAYIFISAVGDCCSKSWFEHVNGIESLIDNEVINVVDRPMPESKDNYKDEHGEEHESLAFYGWTIETKLGRFDLEMRNSSNGYYGGYIEVAEVAQDQYGRKRTEEQVFSALVDF